jgi:hypothetical protein
MVYTRNMPEEIRPRVEQEKTLLTWRALSRPFAAREGQLLTVPMAIAILVGIILVIAGEWMMVGVTAAVMFVYYVWSTVIPEEIEYAITSRGIRVAKVLYAWEAITQWWMMEKWDQKLLMVGVLGYPGGRLALPLGTMEQSRIELLMNKFALNEVPEENRMDKTAKWLQEKFPMSVKK